MERKCGSNADTVAHSPDASTGRLTATIRCSPISRNEEGGTIGESDGSGERILWRPAGLENILAMRGIAESYDESASADFVFGIVHGAAVDVTRGRDAFIVPPDSVGVWHPGQAHCGRPLNGFSAWQYRAIFVEKPELYRISTDQDLTIQDIEFPDPVVSESAITHEFLRMHRLMEGGNANGLEIESALANLVDRLSRRSPTAKRRKSTAYNRRALKVACEFVTENLHRNVTLEEIATVAGMSRFGVVRLFKDGLGMPPHAYQIALRVRRSRHLLEQGLAPGVVGGMVGFYDQSHFVRHFRRRGGLTPGEYAAFWRPESPGVLQ